jgi:threonine/homoserine/homoserine lactone efflux protein
MHPLVLPIVGVAAAHLAGAVSPGPSFLMVAKTAAGVSRRAGLLAALAMGVGVTVWAAAALLGVAVMFSRWPMLYLIARVLGAAFLIWIAIQIWRHARSPLPEGSDGGYATGSRAFRAALWIQLSNPKVAIFFGSIFVAVLPPDLPLWAQVVILLIVFVDECLWYAAVALVLSGSHARNGYVRFKTAIERGTACFLGLIGLRLLFVQS